MRFNYLIVLALLFLVSAPIYALNAASPLTQFAADSDVGDYIGQGLTYLVNANDGKFTPSVGTLSNGKVCNVSFTLNSSNNNDSWRFTFTSTQLNTELVPGEYDNAERAPFASAGHPGLEIDAGSRGSNTLTGTFTVTEAVYDYSGASPKLVSFGISFEQHSEGGSAALRGALYYNSYDHPVIADTSHPDTQAVLSGNIGKMSRFNGPVTVTLNVTDPDGAGDVATTMYNVDGTGQKAYSGPFVVRGDAAHFITYSSSDLSGNLEATHKTMVYIDSTGVSGAAAVSELIMNSDPGDYIGQGASYDYKSTDGTFGMSSGAANVNISFQTPSFTHWWYLDFGTQALGTRIGLGFYDNAMREAFPDYGHPGLDVYGDGRGSNRLTGDFEIIDYTYNDNTNTLTGFAATFNQHSEGGAPALHGTIYYNSHAAEHLAPQHLASITVPATAAHNSTVNGTVTLAANADAGGQYVTLWSDNAARVTVPSTVYVAAGAKSANFTITVSAVSGPGSVNISADGDGTVHTGVLAIDPVFSSASHDS